jgi:cardiolipin synthase
MIKAQWIVFHILPILGFFLAVTLLVHQSRAQRSPSSTLAWLLSILLVPYLGVPAYLIFGGRKIKRMIKSKGSFVREPIVAGDHLITQGAGCIFPLRGNNEVSLLATGEKAYATLVDLIENAQKSIDIATFILGNDETGAAILSALTRRATQGVRVRLLLDALGSFRLSKKILAPLLAGGGRYAFFMPMMHLPFRGRANLRNHRKIIIVDDATAMLGGMNIAREYMGTTLDKLRWHDLSLIVKGPEVADLHRVFCSDWQFAAKQEAVREDVPGVAGGEATGGEATGGEATGGEATGANATTALQIVPSGPDVAGDPLYDDILTALFKARERVWIATPYFVPDEMLLKAICIAARRGIDVRIVVPRVSNHRLADVVRRSYLRQIQDSGAIVCNFSPGMMHGKVIIIDTTLGIVGSMNMDIRSFFLNFEVALFIYDERVVKELGCWLTDLMGQSVQGIRKANVVVEFIEGVTRLLSPLL